MKKKDIKKFYKDNKKTIIIAISFLVSFIIILSVIYFCKLYSNKELERFNNSILALMENVMNYDVEDDYVLINFPDENEIITKNGKIENSKGKTFNEFEKGYVIVYKDGTFGFKLTNGLYCATKGFNDTGVNVDVVEPCNDYEVVYRENAE